MYGAFMLSQAGKKQEVKKTSSWDIRVWILDDDATKFSEYLKSLSEKSESLKWKNFLVESFDDYYTYEKAFFSAFLSWEAPDIFMLPSSQSSALEKQILVLDPTLVSPNDFRKNFKWILGDELIMSDGEEVKKEYLKGVVLGYESLWVYYNRRYFSSEDFSSWSALSSALPGIKEKNTDIIPLGLWNGSTVEGASDILSAFLVLFWGKDIQDIDSQVVSQSLESYLSFGKNSWDNSYDSISSSGDIKTNLDYFSEGTVWAVIGTPRMLQKIDAKWYKKQFLLATPFPQSIGEEKKMWIQYNALFINAASQNQQIAQELLALLTTQDAQKTFLQNFPQYLPALLSLESDMMEQKIHPDYNVVYKDFYDTTAIPVSFKTGDSVLYNTLMTTVLDGWDSAQSLFEIAKIKLICSSAKVTTLTNLSSSCQ